MGSTLIKCSTAFSKISEVEILTAGALDGDTSSMDLLARSRWVSGVTKGAFVPLRTARRLTGTEGAILSSLGL